MKQLIILITMLLLLISCENDPLSSGNNGNQETNSYHNMLKNNVFLGDSIISEQGHYSEYNAIYKFTEDSVFIETGIEENYSYNINNDTLFTSGINNNFIILNIDNEHLKLKSLRNNFLLYLTRYK